MKAHYYKKNAQCRRIVVLGENVENSDSWEFFNEELSETEQARTLSWIDQLADVEWLSPNKFVKLNEAIWELKPTNQVRVLGFHYNNSFVITHGFYKKSEKTPQNQIDKADNRRKKFLNERTGR